MSASKAVSAGCYACFAPPLSSESYCPNKRLRAIQYKEVDAGSGITMEPFLQCLRECQLSASEMIHKVQNPEVNYTDLMLSAVVTALATEINKELERTEHTIEISSGRERDVKIDFSLATAKSLPEHCLILDRHRVILLGSECKPVMASGQEAMPQCMQVCGDGALTLRARGLALEDCIVPGIICAGECMTIVGVALLPQHYPFMMALSPPLSVLEESHRKQLAMYVK